MSEQEYSDRRAVKVGARSRTCTPWGRTDGDMRRESLAPSERRAANRAERRAARRSLSDLSD